LIDFGCGTNLKKAAYTEFAGTPEFYPPEWFNERRYVAEPQTVWSLGVLLWAILYGEVPFQDETAIREYTGSIIHIKVSSTRIILSEDALRFLQKCLHYDEKRRPTLKYMLKSTWLRKMRKVSIYKESERNKNTRDSALFLEHLTYGLPTGLNNFNTAPQPITHSLSTSKLPALDSTNSNINISNLNNFAKMAKNPTSKVQKRSKKIMNRQPCASAAILPSYVAEKDNKNLKLHHLNGNVGYKGGSIASLSSSHKARLGTPNNNNSYSHQYVSDGSHM